MTAVQISAYRGTDLGQAVNFTVSTNAPGTGDFEIRYQLLDGQSVDITKKDIVLFLERLIDAIESGSAFLLSATGGTNYVGPQI